MAEYYEICGNRIPYSMIDSFHVEQKEYIYRPTYREKENSILKAFSKSKYEFFQMQPYAAILGEDEYKSALKEHKTRTFKQAIGKDLIEGTITTIGDKFNIKAFRSKKYKCCTQTGRVLNTYLEDIPAQIIRNDGRLIDVRKNDEFYSLLGESIMPSINIVHALVINADKEYTFYGSGIHIDNLEYEYERLKAGYDAYQLLKLEIHDTSLIEEKSKLSLPKIPRMGLHGRLKKKTNNKLGDN